MTLWETNYEQCFPVGVIKGEKVGQIDIIYVRGKFRQSTLNSIFSADTHHGGGQSIDDGPLASIF